MMVGGFIDAYTFVQRGGILAAGQTGNIIFTSVNIANQDFNGVTAKLVTICAFAFGCFLGEIIRKKHRTHYWRVPVLSLEVIIFAVVGILPRSLPNIAIVPLLACVMAMQTTVFSQIEGRAYNNVFSTGNIKKAMVGLANFVTTHDHHQLTTALIFLQLVVCFALGAMVSAILQNRWGVTTIWWASGLLAVLTVGYAIAIYVRGQRYEEPK
ncbi:DUF1275 domain-containing protein [Levilactobacillus bambusae]|uniref:DUF1275 domain-containing protein n=2 Tax=Levilactobacillus bambusae TaxID=2024736 RepID=A0A2V1MXS1_9LACO|nr:DUF1275 domain-containing protein [Levilactobacillus bambusae]